MLYSVCRITKQKKKNCVFKGILESKRFFCHSVLLNELGYCSPDKALIMTNSGQERKLD
jgi:hypothetical protein